MLGIVLFRVNVVGKIVYRWFILLLNETFFPIFIWKNFSTENTIIFETYRVDFTFVWVCVRMRPTLLSFNHVITSASKTTFLKNILLLLRWSSFLIFLCIFLFNASTTWPIQWIFKFNDLIHMFIWKAICLRSKKQNKMHEPKIKIALKREL